MRAISFFIVTVLGIAGATAVGVSACNSAGSGGAHAAGAVFVIDSTGKIFSFDSSGNAIANAPLPSPISDSSGGGIALAAGDLYVTIGQSTNAVSSFDTTLAPRALPGGAFPDLNAPRGIAYDPKDAEFFVANGAASVSVYGATGSAVTSGGFPAQQGPSGVAYDSDDGTIWVANYASSGGTPATGVAEYTPNGSSAQTFDYATQFSPPPNTAPYSITVCPAAATGGSTLVVVGYIDDGSGAGTASVQSYTTSGVFVGAFAGPITKPYALSCTAQGFVFIADASGLYEMTADGANFGLVGPFDGLTPPLFGVFAGSAGVGTDGGAVDGSAEDSGREETGTGTEEGGAEESSAADTGTEVDTGRDTGTADSGVEDTGTEDAGSPDANTVDSSAGDTGAADSQTTDGNTGIDGEADAEG